MEATVTGKKKLVGTLSGNNSLNGGLGAIIGRDGKSAYEIAVRNGFEGTEQEWLESLKGADGTMTFEDLTDAQRESLRGEKGDRGESGVYLGSGNMPADCNVQIDPNGEVLTLAQLKRLLSYAPAKIATVTLLASAWRGEDSLYSQVVAIDGVTRYSKVDLLPSVAQLAIFHNKDVAFVTENEEGVVTVFAIGDKPTQDYTMQAQITEVEV